MFAHGNEDAPAPSDEPPDAFKPSMLAQGMLAPSMFPVDCELLPEHGYNMSPRSISSVTTDATTPRLGISPGTTDSLPGSPCSLSSLMSNVSLRHEPMDDVAPDHDLETVDEAAESFSTEDHDVANLDMDSDNSTYPLPDCPQRTKDRHEVQSLLREAVENDARGHGKHGLMAYPEDCSWDDGFCGPPPPHPVVSALDTAPAVPSPLSTCVAHADEACAHIVNEPLSQSPPSTLQHSPSNAQMLSLRHESGDSDPSDSESTPLRRRSRRQTRGRKPLKPVLHSSDDESRGRSLSRSGLSVRFCADPPEEHRTHSLSEYDRKPAPVIHRLCSEDLQELRDLHMPLDLLKSRIDALDDESMAERAAPSRVSSPNAVESWQEQALQASRPAARAQSTPLVVLPQDEMSVRRKPPSSDPLADLAAAQQQRDKGSSFQKSSKFRASPRAHRGNSALASSLAQRFGLTQPPPPLPGMGANAPHCGTTDISAPCASDTTRMARPRNVADASTTALRTSRSLSPARSDSGYDSPTAELGASGSEYDLLDGGLPT